MFCDYTGGFLAGFFSTLVGHPLDTIKTQQQLRNIGIFNAAHRIYKHRGPLGFYRGLSVPLIGQGLLNSVFFGVYGDIKDVLQKGQGKSTKGETSFSVIFWAGTIAGTATLPIIGPVELIKTKLQSQMKRKQFAGPKDCLQIVLRDGGVKGLCRGMLPLFWRDGVGGGAYFMGYEAMKAPIERMFPNSPMLKGIMAGGLAGLTNWYKLRLTTTKCLYMSESPQMQFS